MNMKLTALASFFIIQIPPRRVSCSPTPTRTQTQTQTLEVRGPSFEPTGRNETDHSIDLAGLPFSPEFSQLARRERRGRPSSVRRSLLTLGFHLPLLFLPGSLALELWASGAPDHDPIPRRLHAARFGLRPRPYACTCNQAPTSLSPRPLPSYRCISVSPSSSLSFITLLPLLVFFYICTASLVCVRPLCFVRALVFPASWSCWLVGLTVARFTWF